MPALILCLLIGVVQGQNLRKPSPVEAKRMLAALEIPFTLEAFFKAIEQDDVRAVHLFHAAGVDLINT